MEEVKTAIDFTGVEASIRQLSASLQKENELLGKPSEGALNFAMEETIIAEHGVNDNIDVLIYKKGELRRGEINFNNLSKVNDFLTARKAHWSAQFKYMRFYIGDSYIGEEIYQINATEYAIKHIKSLDKERSK